MKPSNPCLSKSDFKVAQTCAAKLYYKRHGFPSLFDTDEYMDMLADGGYMIGLMAQLLFPAGIEIKTDEGTAAAIIETETLLATNKNITLFEPAICINKQLVRIDILVKKGNVLQLIEVKSRSFNSDEYKKCKKKGELYFFSKKWTDYLEDVAYQKKVLQEKFPDHKIECFLMLPDQAKRPKTEGMIHWFGINKQTESNGDFRKPEVTFTGTQEELATLRKDHILEIVNVDEYMACMLLEINDNIEMYIQSIVDDKPIFVQPSCSCKGCEFKITDDEHPQSGFELCWKEKAHTKPHILELSWLGSVNRKKEFEGCIDDLIMHGKTTLNDIPLECVTSRNKRTYYNNRPLYQLTEKHEFLLPGFNEAVRNIAYPLHFIDFETSQMAIPYHAGMRPYEKVNFQWSCHTIAYPGAEPVHSTWLNTTDVYPNFDFGRSLMKQLGAKGTFLIWSQYENTQLKNLHEAIGLRERNDPELRCWLEKVAQFHTEDETLLLDMNNLALKCYFHPIMGGRTSIKVTLPAVLDACRSPRIARWLKDVNLYQTNEEGKIINPYELLPEPQILLDGETIKVKDGAGAMRAYQDMMYGINKENAQIKANYTKVLNDYCRLDTLAMLIIWEHWMQLSKKNIMRYRNDEDVYLEAIGNKQ